MKKAKCRCGFFKVLLCLTGIGAVVGFLFKDKIREAAFNSMYEDTILSLMDVGRLVLDLVQWPIDWVKAMLP